MKNRIWIGVVVIITIALFSIEKIAAQTIGSDGTFIHVRNYSGAVEKKAFRLQLGFQNEDYLNSELLELSIAVKVNSPIANSGGVFNAENLKIRFNEVSQGLILPNASNKTEYQLNDGNQPVEIIKSSADLRKYGTYRFSFDIIVEGGAYLEDLLRDNAYNVGLTFYVTIRTKQGTVFKEVYSGNTFYNIGMQIHKPLGGTPPQPTFMLEVNANATLDFNTPEQYTRQVENNPNNSWVNVTSKNSGYLITVKTNNPNFELIRNDSGVSGDATIPVNVVNVEMQSAGSGTSQGAKTLSSTTAQTLFIGPKNNNLQKLPVRYFITKTEAEKLATKTSGEYRTILTYTLEPN